MHPARESLELARCAKEAIDRSGPDERRTKNLLVNLFNTVEAMVDKIDPLVKPAIKREKTYSRDVIGADA